MRKLLLMMGFVCLMAACNNVQQPQQDQIVANDSLQQFQQDELTKESKIVFYATDSASQGKIEFYPDSITNLLARCVDRGEENNPYVVLDEENCKYSVSFFPMEDSISQVTFFFSSNPDGTDITMMNCMVTKDDVKFSCADIEELLHCTSFIVYPELDGPLMKGFVPD